MERTEKRKIYVRLILEKLRGQTLQRSFKYTPFEMLILNQPLTTMIHLEEMHLHAGI